MGTIGHLYSHFSVRRPRHVRLQRPLPFALWVYCFCTNSHSLARAIHVVCNAQLDVEGAELEVLEGMTEAHWGLVDQFWIEVLDANGRLGKVTDLLKQHGFEVKVFQEELDLMDVIHMYAVVGSRPRGRK